MLPLSSGVRPFGPRVGFHTACASKHHATDRWDGRRSGSRQAPRCSAVDFFAGAGTRLLAGISQAPGEVDFGKPGQGLSLRRSGCSVLA